jgi:heme ABC exporter ATP-binding subunit CcmA
MRFIATFLFNMQKSTHNNNTNKHNILSVNNLSAQMNGNGLYEGVGFSLTEGAVLAVVAPNGTGKTTFLRQLAGLQHIEQGEVIFGGKHIHRLEDYERECIWQGDAHGLIPSLSVMEQLEYIATLWGLKARLPAAIHYMQLKPYLQHQVSELSAGWKRKVSLMRLLLIPAKLWILDEPFNHLDEAGAHLLCGLLNSHADASGMVIFSTPDVRNLPQLPNHRIEILELMDFIPFILT